MKASHILMVTGLLSGGIYLAYNIFLDVTPELVSHTVDENTKSNRDQQRDTLITTTTSKNTNRQQAGERNDGKILTIPDQKQQLAKTDSENNTIAAAGLSSQNDWVEHANSDAMGNSENWQDSIAEAAEDANESSNALESSLQKQPIDTEWSAEAVGAIEKATDGDYIGERLSVVEIDCRSTLCRLEVDLDNEEILTKLENSIALLDENPFSHFFIESYTESNQYNTSIIYITRK